jgi:hypothetical protein
MGNCETCKYWSKETDSDLPKHFGLGKCARVKLFWECTEWQDEAPYDRVLTEESKESLAFVQDGSDYRAELITLKNYGCIQWEQAAEAKDETATRREM